MKVKPVGEQVLLINKQRQAGKPEKFDSPVAEIDILLRDGSYKKIYASVITPVVSRSETVS